MTALKPWCIWVCHPSGVTFHLNTQIDRRQKTQVSLLCGSEGAFSGSMCFQGTQAWGGEWRGEFCSASEGPSWGKFAAAWSVSAYPAAVCWQDAVWSSRGRAHLTVTLWTAFFHPDNSLFIPDCSVLQTFVKFGGKWKIITLQVENDFNCCSDILVHRNLLSTFHHRELLIHLLPFCRSLLTANKVSTFPFRQLSTPLFWAYIFSYLICRAIPFFSLFLTFSFQTTTLEVLTFDSQYFDKVFS